MKKLLLISAMAALAIGASADGYKLEKVWEINDVSFLPTNETRQGFGMNGKFYINDKSTQTVYVVDQNGLTGETYPGGANCGISRDEAGNIIVSNATFPGAWGATASIKVIDPATGNMVEHMVPVEDCGILGRSDFIGFPQGNLMQDGVFYFTGATNDGICIMTITDGEVNTDECYNMLVEGLNRDNLTVVNYYIDINGNENLMFVYRSSKSVLKIIPLYGDEPTVTSITLPEKGNCNGTFAFVWDNKQLYLYPTVEGGNYSNYRDGLAVAEANAETPLVQVPFTATANPNAFQADWLNAEVDAEGVTIYQYVPGYCLRVWRLTKEEPVYTVASNILNDWAISEENNMTLGEDGIYYLAKDNVELTGGTMIEYKVTSDGTWWPADFNAEYYIGEDGIYDLVFTFNPDGGIVGIQVTKHEDPQPEMVYTVVGPAHVFGSEWDPTDTNNDMTLDPETNLYTWTKQGVQLDDFFGFKVVGNHSWDYEWPIGFDNNWNAYLPDGEGPGVYDIVITYDPAQPDEKITCTLTKQTFLRGDVDMDGFIKISDVTALINYLLSNDPTGIDLLAADCDMDGFIKISDVTTLINYLLSGNWE